jgi:hypothetical protein
MRAPVSLRTCLGACALAWTCIAGAVPFVVQLGADRLVLDTPAGFADTLGLGSPRLNELAESLAGPSVRVLSFAITDADLRRFMNGEPPEFKRYAVAGTAREFERLRATQEDFQKFVSDALRGLGEAPPAGSDLHKLLGAAPEGKPMLLEFLRRDASVASYIQGTRLANPKRAWNDWDVKPPVLVLVSTSLAMVRGRPVNLSITISLEDPADIEWLELNTRRWLEQVQRLNP